jgi:hypothetical protein
MPGAVAATFETAATIKAAVAATPATAVATTDMAAATPKTMMAATTVVTETAAGTSVTTETLATVATIEVAVTTGVVAVMTAIGRMAAATGKSSITLQGGVATTTGNEMVVGVLSIIEATGAGVAAEEGATETVESQVGIVVVGKARASRNGAAWRSPSSTRRRILSLQCRF